MISTIPLVVSCSLERVYGGPTQSRRFGIKGHRQECGELCLWKGKAKQQYTSETILAPLQRNQKHVRCLTGFSEKKVVLNAVTPVWMFALRYRIVCAIYKQTGLTALHLHMLPVTAVPRPWQLHLVSIQCTRRSANFLWMPPFAALDKNDCY